MTRPRQRLVTRVVISTITSAAIGGLLTASLAIVAVDRLVSSHGDQRLSGAAVTLTGEIDENEVEGEQEALTDVLIDENQEIAASGIHLAVFDRNHRLVAGNETVPAVAAGGCETVGVVGQRIRACARQHGEWLLVAAQPSDEARLIWFYVLAALGALVMSGLMGAAASLRLTRWALRPLTRLGDAIRRLPAKLSVPEDLGEASPCEEVEEIRLALANLIERLEALLSQAHRFAADAAHELRTPLTTIAGELELLAEEATESDDRSALRRLHERTAQLGALVERLLVLASPLAEQEHKFETVALADVIGDVVTELPAERRARVRLQMNGEGLTRGEPSLLRSLFSNAIDNALKFSGNAAVEVHLSESDGKGSSAPESARFITVDVRDQGTGVPFAERERVFRPMYRADPSLARGYGLGLPLIGHIVRCHGGTAAFVDSSSGACLRVSLPSWLPRTRETARA
jgi:two-component system, OmpR family, sensor kinase